MERAILCLICLLSTGILTAQDKAPLKKIVVATHWRAQAQFAGIYVAKESGYYQNIGLDVIIKTGDSTRSLQEILETGEVDIAVDWLANGIEMHINNPDIINIGQIFQHSSVAIVVRRNSGIKSLRDLNGKSIAAWPGSLYLLPQLLFKRENLQMEVRRTFNPPELFLWDAADAATIMIYNEYHDLLMSGLRPAELLLFPLKDYGLDIPEDGLYCLKSKYESNKKAYYLFLKETIRGWQKAFANEKQTLEIVRKYCVADNAPFSISLQRRMLRALSPLIFPGNNFQAGILTRREFETTAAILKEEHRIPTIPAYKTFYYGPLPAPQNPGNSPSGEYHVVEQ